jgi:hypothetical protein
VREAGYKSLLLLNFFVVPQEGFEPPTPSLRSANSDCSGGARYFPPICWSATSHRSDRGSDLSGLCIRLNSGEPKRTALNCRKCNRRVTVADSVEARQPGGSLPFLPDASDRAIGDPFSAKWYFALGHLLPVNLKADAGIKHRLLFAKCRPRPVTGSHRGARRINRGTVLAVRTEAASRAPIGLKLTGYIEAPRPIDNIAVRDACSRRRVNITLSLAFAGKASVDGRRPHEIGVARQRVVASLHPFDRHGFRPRAKRPF